MDRAFLDRAVVLLVILCLTIGAATHIYDNIIFGFLPYRFAPTWINIYWTSLSFVDLLAVYFLLRIRKVGVLLTLAIMLSNVIINSLAYYSLNVISDPLPLQLQTLFFGFCLGSSPWLIKRQKL